MRVQTSCVYEAVAISRDQVTTVHSIVSHSRTNLVHQFLNRTVNTNNNELCAMHDILRIHSLIHSFV